MVASKIFEFDNRAENLTRFTRHLLDDLTALLMPYHHESNLLFKVKVIIIELLNNAVKHSGSNQTHLELHLDATALVITKTDTGEPFKLLNELKDNDTVMIRSDAMHVLYATKAGPVIHFTFEENLAEEVDVNQLSEHLGLLMIAKAANEFTYQYQQLENVFKVKLYLSGY